MKRMKRLLSVALCILMILPTCIFPAQAEENADATTAAQSTTSASVAGDVNADGTIDSSDALRLLRYTLDPVTFWINQDGDMNGDGKIGTGDAVYLLRHSMIPGRYSLMNEANPSGTHIAPAADGNTRQTMTYKIVDGHELKMDYYPPYQQTQSPAPIVLLIPGGGWMGSDRTNMYNFCWMATEELRNAGIAVACLEYRIFPEDGLRMEMILSDVMDACRYLSRYENQLHINTDKLVTLGHSAGGHLALMTALSEHKQYVQGSPFDAVKDDFTVVATVALSPVTQLYRNAQGNDPLSFSIDYVFEDSKSPELDKIRFSPIDVLDASAVPMHIQIGSIDNVVRPDNMMSLVNKAVSLGVDVHAMLVENGGHSFEQLNPDLAVYPDVTVRQVSMAHFIMEQLAKIKDPVLSYSAPTANADTAQVLTYKKIDDRELKLNYYPPYQKREDGPVPVALLIPGGAWMASDKDNMYNYCWLATETLRNWGVAVVSMEYRIFPEENLTMDMLISDVMDACRYLSHYSSELNVDASRISTLGMSAGGHLALMAGIVDHSEYTKQSPFDAVKDDFNIVSIVALSPVTQLYTNEDGQDPLNISIDYLFRYSTDPQGDAHRFSPIDQITSDIPPIHIQIGTLDDTVLPANMTKFVDKALELGVQMHPMYVENGGHAFEQVLPDKEVYPDLQTRQSSMAAFILLMLGYIESV